MSLSVATWLVYGLGLYLAAGVLVAIPFVIAGVQRIDPAARGATVGFRLIILPGAVALWPLVLRRWLSGATAPPEERSPHRLNARAPSGPAS